MGAYIANFHWIFSVSRRHLMTSVGEALSHEEVDEMFQEAGVGGDDFKINYVKFVEIMTK